ncbi:MAG: tRNA (N(6)-L-threonylcarbamoyladenosine(37)-C(2))-methylthiotransferase MtaB [Candidatus Omnitrophota bacterium]
MKKRVKFYTLGCKTNQYETQAIKESLMATGAYIEAEKGRECDLFIVNTCTVTAKADKESRCTVRRCNRENPKAKVLVTGCLAEMDEEMIKRLPGVSFIAKNRQKYDIPSLLEGQEPRVEACQERFYSPLEISNFGERDRAFVKIQDGCDNFCSYCKVPLVRGRSRSRQTGDIIQEVERLISKGFKEVVLTGICLGDWGGDIAMRPSLRGLIDLISSINGDFRIRLSSIEPKMVTDELIASISDNKKVCPHLHIPLQSGSDRILKLMRRPYSAKEYIKIISKAKRAIKGLSITSDVMVGFPGESRDDFNATLKMVRQIAPSRLHIFAYSRREGTAAARLRLDISSDEINRRRERLEEEVEASSYRYRKRFLNKTVQALIESKRDPKTGLLTGYTERYIRFLLDGPDAAIGKLLPLKIHNVDLKATYCIF